MTFADQVSVHSCVRQDSGRGLIGQITVLSIQV